MNVKRLGLVSVGAFLFLLLLITLSSGPVLADSTVTVNIPNNAGNNQSDPGYRPNTITVVIGVNATVQWMNGDTATHTAIADSGNVFNSGDILSGQSYTFSFTSPGTYPYHCSYHSWMHGTVIVKAGAVPEFPIGTLAVLFFGVIAVAALASGRFRSKSSTYRATGSASM